MLNIKEYIMYTSNQDVLLCVDKTIKSLGFSNSTSVPEADAVTATLLETYTAELNINVSKIVQCALE